MMKKNHAAKRTKGITCPYSPSCFTCPLTDCVVDGSGINILPGERRLEARTLYKKQNRKEHPDK